MVDTQRIFAAIAVLGLLFTSGCGANNSSTEESASAAFPMTFENCGQEVTIEKLPERVVLLQGGAIPLLDAVGALEKVVSIAGKRDTGRYPDDIRAQIEQIPGIGSPSAAQEVSLEAVIAQNPDLLQNPTFEDIYPQVEFYGRLFGNEDQAPAAVTDLRNRVAAVRASAQDWPDKRTAAALFVSGGLVSGGYGAGSMQDAQMEILGLTNVFGDVPGRFIEPSRETTIERDPDLIIAIIDFDDIGKAAGVIRSLPGAERITAVRNDDILELPFEFTDPPTPFSVLGLERIAKFAAP